MAGSKKKFYQLMPVLDIYDSINYLTELIGNELEANEFMALVKDQGLRVFVDAERIENKKKKISFKEVGTGREVAPMGLHELIQGVEAGDGVTYSDDWRTSHQAYIVIGECPVVFSGQDHEGKTVEWEILDGRTDYRAQYSVRPLLFKPADIQILADKLNGKTPKENQEAELIQLRGRVQELESENESLKASGAVAGGLTFPYSTPELEAMHKAANRHWAGYSNEMRKPTQKEIRMDIAETLGMDPTRGQRKPVELTAAIKPKEYRET